jgi:hypothetical protein
MSSGFFASGTSPGKSSAEGGCCFILTVVSMQIVGTIICIPIWFHTDTSNLTWGSIIFFWTVVACIAGFGAYLIGLFMIALLYLVGSALKCIFDILLDFHRARRAKEIVKILNDDKV